ncbi:hypothetical protein UFOVP84_65 [uncultured Caudovirales phage]|uniref:Uncharacterized protein n=1 Tax=uncultured Caudovirales phage TaxID=2100421 RepID=A0A6J5L1K3_9CAUD|nr:hypothetical protein UFOVP84_65 [uncultured Caudovirales phage]
MNKEVLWFFGVIIILVCSIIYGLSLIPKLPASEPTALFTKDGCTIYRWYDKGQRMYYTKCDDGTSPTISR